MAPEHVLDRFEQLLDEERSALRQLDSARIDQFAAEKAALMEALQHGLRDRPDLTPRFRDVAPASGATPCSWRTRGTASVTCSQPFTMSQGPGRSLLRRHASRSAGDHEPLLSPQHRS